MTAAELLARAEKRAAAIHLGLRALEFGVYVLLALALYSAGARRGRTSATIAAIHAQRDTVMDTIRVVEKRIVVDTQRVRVTSHAASVARASFDSAQRAVVALADSAPSAPITLALPALQVCQQALAADTVAHDAVVATLVDMTDDRDAQRKRAEGDERELQTIRPSRFGFKSGLAAGLAVAAALVHFLR